MLSRAASTARAARSLLQRARRDDAFHSRCSVSAASSSSTRPSQKQRASIARLAGDLDGGGHSSCSSSLATSTCSSEQATTTTSSSSSSTSLDLHFMRLALGQARMAAARGEVPVGALLVARDGSTVLAAEGNGVEGAGDATAHAELLCLQRAAAEAVLESSTTRRGSDSASSSSSSAVLSATTVTTTTTTTTTTLWPRSATAGSTLYVTLEPCAMCAGAALLARVGRIVYGARNAGAGADGSWVSLLPREGGGGGGDDEKEGEEGEEEGDAFSYPSLTPLPARPHHSHPALEVTRGVLSEECGGLLKDFFRRRRAEGTRERV